MAQTVQVDSSGVTLRADDGKTEAFQWGVGKWSLQLWDPRLDADHVSIPPRLQGVTPVSGPRAVLRIVSFDPTDRDQDRDLMGLRLGAPSDSVLLTDVALPGEIELCFGPLHVHKALITDAEATSLITEAFRRGFEVRQWVTTRGSGYALVSEVTTKLASDTPEFVSRI